MHRSRTFWRYSRWDVLPVSVMVFAITQFVVLATVFRRLPWPVLVVAATAHIVLMYSVLHASHYHVHKPYFVSRTLNKGFKLLVSAFIGLPHSGYGIGHLYHHDHAISYSAIPLREVLGVDSIRGVLNSLVIDVLDAFRLGPLYGLWRITRGPEGQGSPARAPDSAEDLPDAPVATATDEEIPSDSWSGYFGAVVGVVYDTIDTRGPALRRQILAEALSATAFRFLLLAIDWRFFVFYFMPVMALQRKFSAFEEYCQHYGADASNEATNSASCYAWLDNLLTFNGGYHQEHHLHPHAHWTDLKSLRGMVPVGEEHRRVVPVSALSNAFIAVSAPQARGPADSTSAAA